MNGELIVVLCGIAAVTVMVLTLVLATAVPARRPHVGPMCPPPLMPPDAPETKGRAK